MSRSSYPGEALMFLIRLLLVLSFSMIAACEQRAAVPDYLKGVWETTALKYADRYLKLTEDLLIFSIGEGEEAPYAITKVKVNQQDKKELYSFHCIDREGEKWVIALACDPDSGGAIQMKNRDEVLRKAFTEESGSDPVHTGMEAR